MESKLIEIFNTILTNKGREPVKSLSAKDNLRDNIGLDSLDLAELTVRIEAEFGKDIFESGIIYTVGEIFEKLGK